jgi:hypothetical protein
MKVHVHGVETEVRVEAAFSVPRLTFSDNFFCAAQALLPLGIAPTKFTGAFWEQCLDRVLLDMVDRTDWILTVDYDSVFEAETVQRLMAAALVSGYDAVAPLQTKRDEGVPMFTPEGHTGGIGLVTLPTSWFEATVQPVDTAHFGCTLIRAAALRKTPAPWFLGAPREDGHWGDAKDGERGRVDPDIHFWKAFKAAGHKVGLAPQIAIGHAELKFTWPGRDLKAVYQSPTNYWTNGSRRPPEAWGSEAHQEASAK